MRLITKHRIDSALGRPLVWTLNLLANPLGKLLRRDHAIPGSRYIVLCKLMGLGSLVQLTPLMSALKSGFPESKLVLITRASNRDYCARLAPVDECLVVDDSGPFAFLASLAKVLLRTWGIRPDLFVNLEIYANLGALLAILSCARNRLGYFITPRDQRAWGIYTHMVYFNRSAPIYEVYLQAARALGLKAEGLPLVEPRIADEDYAALRAKLLQAGIPEGTPLLVVNPNSSELCRERRWPPSSFGAVLGRFLQDHPDWRGLLVGAPGEEDQVQAVLASIPAERRDRLRDLTGQLTLGEFFALLKEARLFLTNDSGPMHVAFSLNVPTVALFGPVHPEHYGGASHPSRALIYHRLYCSPCVHHFHEAPCRGDNQCMKWITPEEVLEAMEGVLEGRPSADFDPELHYLNPGSVFGAHQRQTPHAR